MKLTGDDGREYSTFLPASACAAGSWRPAVLGARGTDQKAHACLNYFYIEQRGQVAALLSKLANDDVDGARVLADAIAAGDETTAAALVPRLRMSRFGDVLCQLWRRGQRRLDEARAPVRQACR
ncbi:MAG: hypothetical protein ACLTYW_05585 [Collinsella sp.]